MKVIFMGILFFTSSIFAFGQNWLDTIQSARNQYKKENYKEALRLYQSAQKIAPKGIDLSDEIGQSAYKSREFDKAEKVFRESSSSKGTIEQKAKTYHNLGNSKMQQKNYSDAIEAYKESLRNNPYDEETRYNLAEAMRKQENQKKEQNQKNQNEKNNQDKDNGKDDSNEKKDSNQSNDSKNKNENQENKSQLADKKTDRILDDLMKKEIQTKKKIDASKGEKSTKTSGKDW
jgi:Ca-activated chloride channel homolog